MKRLSVQHLVLFGVSRGCEQPALGGFHQMIFRLAGGRHVVSLPRNLGNSFNREGTLHGGAAPGNLQARNSKIELRDVASCELLLHRRIRLFGVHRFAVFGIRKAWTLHGFDHVDVARQHGASQL